MNHPELQDLVDAPRSRLEVELKAWLNTFVTPIHHRYSPFVVLRCLLP